jgi:hypothetical protein
MELWWVSWVMESDQMGLLLVFWERVWVFVECELVSKELVLVALARELVFGGNVWVSKELL